MENKVKCPHCGKDAQYGKRDAFNLGMGETPYVCEDHGEIGYRDHDFGSDVIYDTK